ncbi:SGNH/GDSL hydrolase family protein [Pseudomarimonas arenosa]|uniref:SGNH/GDSL hydrolase family protein n=1 Tax=Pseudomarimonas arenosa TaxID=2774145 RepID=A0AAW3ZRE5_9GAMM|nr:SGNH/GDSL hydrolase family protein [Pseudomarimonas arenosa]MBD8527642.1 SGNH/GDSL hydrolase family protein [Pseudomarimonas arenosa]
MFSPSTLDPRSMLFWSGLPFIATQGLWLKRRAYRAPEAPGPRHGLIECDAGGPPLRLRALGDSIIAGVALASTADALPAQLARALSAQTMRSVDWQALGRNGADASEALSAAHADSSSFRDCDLVLISIGVNDVTGLRRRRAFASDLSALIDWLHGQSPKARIVFCATPPLEVFPLLPSPLRHLMGLRARQFDQVIARAAESQPLALHAPIPFRPDASGFADDGFHPNSASVARWSEWLSGQVLQRWSDLGRPSTPIRV